MQGDDWTTAPPEPPPEREPPWSLEAEQSLLGALLLDNVSRGLVGDIVHPKVFYRHDHQLIYTAISELLDDRHPADVVTVHERLSAKGLDPEDWGGLQYLNQLSSCVPSSRNCRRYAELVSERYIERQLIAAGDDALKMAWNGKVDAGTRIERMMSLLSQVEQLRKNPGARMPMLRLDELQAQAQRITWLVKHVIPAESVGMMFGGSGTFKSFLAIDCALHVAHGLPWMGRKTRKGQVLIIAAEGGAGMWGRIEAWHKARNLRWSDADLMVVPVAVDLTQDAWRVVDAAQARGAAPVLVVVDTLSQTFTGEENSANEMAAYLRELGLRFRMLWQCCVLVIHHSGHQQTERPRGSSAIKGNLDFMLGVHRDEKEMLATMSCEKQKDGDLFADAFFALNVMQLGVDEDNDPITSLVARHLGTEQDVQEAREREAAAGRGGRSFQFMSLVPPGGTDEKSLRKAFYSDVVDGLDSEAKKKAYQRAKDAAIKAKLIEVVEGFVIDLRKGRA